MHYARKPAALPKEYRYKIPAYQGKVMSMGMAKAFWYTLILIFLSLYIKSNVKNVIANKEDKKVENPAIFSVNSRESKNHLLLMTSK